MTSKNCSRCSRKLPLSQFYKDNRSASGHQAYCKTCNNIYRRRRRRVNKEYRENNKRSLAESRARLRAEIHELKAATPCLDCGGFFKPWQMQYDHVSGDKLGNVATLVNQGSRNKVFEEIKKCELVCANCHADRTYRRRAALVQ